MCINAILSLKRRDYMESRKLSSSPLRGCSPLPKFTHVNFVNLKLLLKYYYQSTESAVTDLDGS